jgi:hypothetical protein
MLGVAPFGFLRRDEGVSYLAEGGLVAQRFPLSFAQSNGVEPISNIPARNVGQLSRSG